MNLLFTCVGSRNYLLEYFRAELGPEDRLLAADNSPMAPALVCADKQFIVQPVHTEGYIEELLSIAERESVDVIISLNDLELPILADAAKRFTNIGTRLLVSTSDVIAVCFDKWKTAQLFNKLNINTPKTYIDLEEAIKAIEAGSLTTPLVVKPRWGSQSIAVEYIDNKDDLRYCYEMTRSKYENSKLRSKLTDSQNILIQEVIHGNEYGLDVINDLDGNYCSSVARKKHAMRAGETDIATVLNCAALSEAGEKIGRHLRHVGLLDADFFINDSGIYGLELNPRFGGGYPFSHMAGVNVPKAIVQWLHGKPVSPELFKVTERRTFAKVGTLVEVNNGNYKPSES